MRPMRTCVHLVGVLVVVRGRSEVVGKDLVEAECFREEAQQV